MSKNSTSADHHISESVLCWKVATSVGVGAIIGAFLLLLALVVWPVTYFEIADRFRWRTGAPAAGQIRFEDTLTKVMLRGESIAGDHAIVLFGDSHLQGLPSSALGGKVNNFAIGGETATRLAARIARYTSLGKAKLVILLSGANDLAVGSSVTTIADALTSSMQQIPASTPVLLVAVPPPIDATQLAPIERLNTELAGRCLIRPSCKFVALTALADRGGLLREEYAAPDGIHLSPGGYQILATVLTNELGRVR